MKLNLRTFMKVLLLCVLSFIFFQGKSFAHPEDDFCGPESGISEQLCQQLSNLNREGEKVISPLLDEKGKVRTAAGSAIYFGEIGVRHILPGGLDHILFILALFLTATNLRNLTLQISVFTLAHTITLGLTAAGLITPPPSIVEPLIALSIAIVAIEAVSGQAFTRWRFLIILGFGLFHGMGFAGFIKDVGLPTEQFWPSLIGFNLGVEVGQLSVILAAAILIWPIKLILAKGNMSFRKAFVIPSSIIIFWVGIWWFITRSLGL